MNNTTIDTIGKYALLLSALYGLDVLLNYYILSNIFKHSGLQDISSIKNWIYLIPYSLNIVAALYVNSDIKSMNIKGRYSVLLTVIYRPIGIVLFLLYVINNELTNQQELKNI